MPPMDESSLGCHGARYVPYARGWYAWGPGGKLPCASRWFSTREPATRGPYVQSEGPGCTCELRPALAALDVRAARAVARHAVPQRAHLRRCK